MQRWVPLFEIFMNSACPETEASLWLQKSFNPSSSTSSSISTSSFLSLLTSSAAGNSSSPESKRVMYVQTLPNAVQARILSFLVYERRRFCRRDLVELARSILAEGQDVDFWVKKGAQQLLDVISGSGFEWISELDLDSEDGNVEDRFKAVPDWLQEAATKNRGDLVLPWLPMVPDEICVRRPFCGSRDDELSEKDVVRETDDDGDEIMGEVRKDVVMDPEIEKRALLLKSLMLKFETTSKTVELAEEIRKICLTSGVDVMEIMTVIEPWKADDETASIMITHFLGKDGDGEDEFGWPSYVLCSIVLPKLFALEVPASRVLVSATIEFCKVHQKAAEYALLSPLLQKVGGINNPICDVVTRIVRECLHPAHVSSFCQKLLCEELDAKSFTCLPCHRCLIAGDLVWTESLFYLMQFVLNHNVRFTQDTVDTLVKEVCKFANMFPKSLKLGNFCLCFVTKCAPLLRSHKVDLIVAIKHTNSLVTKSLLSKLSSL